MSVTDSDKLIENLLNWYDESGRILPWREEPTPYHVWVSEIMLQQTRVEAVKGYYARFLEAFPTVYELASAEESLLLKMWEGLGYYNRVRNMQKAAVIIVEQYNGVLPDSYEELLGLPGIGEYTAAAISSIAYGKHQAVVDGNVFRVMTRITADATDISQPSFKKKLAAELNACLNTYIERVRTEQTVNTTGGFSRPETEQAVNSVNIPGRFNQAMMDLGATVCTPSGMPKCSECPALDLCIAHKKEQVLSYPVKAKARPRTKVEMTVFLIRNGDRYVITKRGAKGLLAGMYEFPNVPSYYNEKECVDYVTELGFYPLHVEPLPPAVHIFTHREWHMKAYEIRVSDWGEMEFKKNLLPVTVEMMKTTYAIPSAFSPYLQRII